MKIRLIDGSVHDVTRAEVTNGRLEIDFQNISSEEIQKIFSIPALLTNIDLLTDDDRVTGSIPGYIVYSGVMLLGDTKTLLLTTESNVTAERLANAEANATLANAVAEVAKTMSVEMAKQMTDLQIAMCELYEGMEV